MGLADNYERAGAGGGSGFVTPPKAPGVTPLPHPALKAPYDTSAGPSAAQGRLPRTPAELVTGVLRDAPTPRYRMGDNDTPVPYGDPQREIQRWGTDAPKGFDLPKVRVPGVDFDPSAFQYGGVSQDQWNSQAGQMANRAAPSTNYGDAMQSRQMQMQGGLGGLQQAQGMYAAMAQGQGPSLANLQLQQGVDRGMASQMAMANSMRGGGLARASAMQGAQMAGGAMQNQAVNQAAQQRMNEQMQGMQGLAGTSAQYGQLAGQMNQADAQRAQYLSQMALQNRQNNDQTMMGLYGLGMNAQQQDMGGRMAFATTQGQADLNTQIQNAAIEKGIAAQEISTGTNIAGAALGAGGSALGYFTGKR